MLWTTADTRTRQSEISIPPTEIEPAQSNRIHKLIAHTYIHTYIYGIHKYIHLKTWPLVENTYIHTYIHTYTNPRFIHKNLKFDYTGTYIHTHTHTHIYIYYRRFCEFLLFLRIGGQQRNQQQRQQRDDGGEAAQLPQPADVVATHRSVGHVPDISEHHPCWFGVPRESEIELLSFRIIIITIK